MKKRLLSLALTLCMVLTLLPVTALAGDEASITIAGKTLNSTTPYLVAGEAASEGTLGENGCTAYYNAAKKTLQLKDATVDAISSDEDLTIEFSGTNVVTNTGTHSAHGIHCAKKLTVRSAAGAPGTLTATGGTGDNCDGFWAKEMVIESGTISGTGLAVGIYAEETFKIYGGTITATGGSYGIQCGWGEDVLVHGAATITASGTPSKGKAFYAVLKPVNGEIVNAQVGDNAGVATVWNGTAELNNSFKYVSLSVVFPNVSNFAELKAALADSNIETITLTDDITAEEALTIGRDVTIVGGGKTLSAPVTGVDAQGVVQAGSEYTIFTVDSGKTVTMKNLTVMGGSNTAIKNSGALSLENVTITRSGSSSVAGGGLSNTSSGTLILKNCSVIRNVANNGGGMLNSGGTVVLDGCSLSENRSIASNGGGGAIENKSSGKMYINNSVIANNTSSEIGGGINNYNSESTLYLMNTTVTGNATTKGAGHGGGIGNNGGPLYAVNSIITDNYFADTAATTTAPSDIGYTSNGTNHLYYCVYGTLSDATLTTDTGNKTGDDNTADLFAAYVNAGVLSEEGKVSTKPYAHPQLLQEGSLLYAPLKEGSAATTGGADATYFDYTDLSSVKMSYKATDASDETAFGGLATGGTAVTTYIEGGDREASVIGASAASATKYFTVTLFQGEGGKATGGTNHGDAYAENAEVTLTATPNAGYRFVGWSDGSAIISSASSYTFAVTKTVALTPVFAVVDTSDDDSEPTYAILDNTAADANGSLTRSKTYAEAGEIVKLTPKANSGYALDTLTVKDSKGNVIETTQNADGTYSFRMPRGKATVAATFKAVEAAWVNPFEDVAESDWFFDEVKFTAINGIFAGTQPNRFSPNAPMTRAMFWTVMGRLDGQTLSGSGVYDAAREWAMTKGITDGTNPGDSITREQLITILWRYTGSPMLMDYPGLAQFEDAGSISSYARQAMAWAHQQGLIEGADGKLIPQSNATRAQVAAILTRYCQNAK